MSVDRKPADRFSSNADQAQRTAKHLADFIMDNRAHLAKVDKTGKLEKAAKSFHFLLANGERLTPGQYSFLENIYEKTMEGASYNAAVVHADRKRRGLKYG